MADSNGHLSFAVVNPSALTSPIHTSYASPVCGSSEQDRSQNAEKVSRFSYAGIKSTCMKKYDVAVVVVVIVVVWVLLALPTIFYSLPNVGAIRNRRVFCSNTIICCKCYLSKLRL